MHVQPAASRPALARARGLERLLGRQAELRAVVAVRIASCVSASTPGVTRTSIRATPAAAARSTSSSASSTTRRACRAGRRELFVALVVPVHDEPSPGDPGLQRELELAQRRDVRAEPFLGEQPHHGQRSGTPSSRRRRARPAPPPVRARRRARSCSRSRRRAACRARSASADSRIPPTVSSPSTIAAVSGKSSSIAGILPTTCNPPRALSSGRSPTPERPRSSPRAAGSSSRRAGWPGCGSRL